ncbi:hypothetical protein [Dokdonia sp. Asnod1-B02]|uniref:hypothetical protein n=1 Tax=Dokdonia sp. Asnod1-B02 TaxID=3160573 RepID=UPI003867BAEA
MSNGVIIMDEIKDYSIKELDSFKGAIDKLIESKRIYFYSLKENDKRTVKLGMLNQMYHQILSGIYPEKNRIVDWFSLQAEHAKHWLNDEHQSARTQTDIFNQGITDDAAKKFKLNSDWKNRDKEIQTYLGKKFFEGNYSGKTYEELESYYGTWDDIKDEVIKGDNFLEHPYERIGVRLMALRENSKSLQY